MKARIVRVALLAPVLLIAAAPAGAAATASGLALSPWPMFQHDPLHSGRSAATGITKPTLAWKVHVAGEPSSPVIGADGTIYVATGMEGIDKTGYLYALSPAGMVKWRSKLPGPPAATAPAVAADGTIYVHINGGEGNTVAVERLVAVNPDGTVKWIFKTNGGAGSFTSSTQSSPVIGPDGTIYFGSMDTRLYALGSNRKVRWAVSPSSSSIDSSPALEASRNVVYVQDAASTVSAYGTKGMLKWQDRISTTSGGDSSAAVSASNGVLYIAAQSPPTLYAINPDGTIAWHKPLGSSGDFAFSTPAIGPSGTIYIGLDGLYAFTPAGVLKWHALPFVPFSSAAPVVAADGTIYWDAPCTAGGATQGLCAVNPAGTLRWSITLPSTSSQGLDPAPAIGANGSLYVSAPDVFNKSDQTVRKYT